MFWLRQDHPSSQQDLSLRPHFCSYSSSAAFLQGMPVFPFLRFVSIETLILALHGLEDPKLAEAIFEQAQEEEPGLSEH